MKKISIIITILSLATALSASAQVFRLGVGVAGFGLGKNSAGVQIPLIDLGWAPQPSYDFGLYTGFGLDGSASDAVDSGTATGGFRIGGQGRYFFNTEGVFRPYLGVQAGMLAGATVTKEGSDVDTKTSKFQVTPLAGVRVGPLNIWANYMNKNVYANIGLLFGIGSFK